MAKFETIRLELWRDGIARLQLARPKTHNAFDRAMIVELYDAAETLRRNDEVRAVLLCAQGRSFCSGGDLRWMQAQAEASDKERMRDARALAEMLSALNALPMPVIARVQGNAYGGGLGLMAISDIVVASSRAKFAFTETRLGLIPATIGPFVLHKLGPAAGRACFITGSPIDAKRALSIGLVSRIASPLRLDSAVQSELETVRQAAPGALRAAKGLAMSELGRPSDAQIEHAIAALAHRWLGKEANQGIAAFFDKKPPPWVV